MGVFFITVVECTTDLPAMTRSIFRMSPLGRRAMSASSACSSHLAYRCNERRNELSAARSFRRS